MRRSLFIALLICLGAEVSGAHNDDLLCVSKDVFDTGYFVVGHLDQENRLEMQIEAVNYWAGNKLEYSQSSVIVLGLESSCEHRIVDQIENPKTVLIVSKKTGPYLHKLNGKKTERFMNLECEASARLIQLMGCKPINGN